MISRYEKGERDVEGFGITFLEAGACGVPVIGGRSGGIPDAIQDGFSGFLVDPGDHERVADRLKTLLADDETRKRLGIQARRRVLEQFTWEKYVDRMAAFLNERGVPAAYK
jgi:phosphatidylinositol alpha-1,6-mannosyltransferase